MSEKEVIATLKKRGIEKIEIHGGHILADFGIDREYWLNIPPVFGQEWVRVLLIESGAGECLSDRLWFTLEDALDSLSITASIDYARFHDDFAAIAI